MASRKTNRRARPQRATSNVFAMFDQAQIQVLSRFLRLSDVVFSHFPISTRLAASISSRTVALSPIDEVVYDQHFQYESTL